MPYVPTRNAVRAHEEPALRDAEHVAIAERLHEVPQGVHAARVDRGDAPGALIQPVAGQRVRRVLLDAPPDRAFPVAVVLVHPRTLCALQERVEARQRVEHALVLPGRRTRITGRRAEAVVGRDHRLAEDEVRDLLREAHAVESARTVLALHEIGFHEIGMPDIRGDHVVDPQLEAGTPLGDLPRLVCVELRHLVAAPLDPVLPGVRAQPGRVGRAAQGVLLRDGYLQPLLLRERLHGVVVVAADVVAEGEHAVARHVQAHALEP